MEFFCPVLDRALQLPYGNYKPCYASLHQLERAENLSATWPGRGKELFHRDPVLMEGIRKTRVLGLGLTVLGFGGWGLYTGLITERGRVAQTGHPANIYEGPAGFMYQT